MLRWIIPTSFVLASAMSIVIDWEKIASVVAVIGGVFTVVGWLASRIISLSAERHKVLNDIAEMKYKLIEAESSHRELCGELKQELQYLRNRLDDHLKDRAEE